MPTRSGDSSPDGRLVKQLAHHDAAISGLSSRIGHVEQTLGSHGSILKDHGSLLQEIKIAVTTNAAKPVFNFHQTVSTVTTLAVLFSMVCGGIIWITTGQFAATLAKQEAINERDTRRLDLQSAEINKLQDKLGWVARIEPASPRKP